MEQLRKRQEICRSILGETEHNLRVVNQSHEPTFLEASVLGKFEYEFWLLPSDLAEAIHRIYSSINEENDLLRSRVDASFRKNDLWMLLRTELSKLEDTLRKYDVALQSQTTIPPDVQEGRAEVSLLLRKIFDGQTILAIGRELRDPYCLKFNESGYDKDYRFYDENEAAASVADAIQDDRQLLVFSQKYKDKLKSYRDFRGRNHTYVAKLRELKLEGSWGSIARQLEVQFQKHGKATYAVLKAYLELREDYPTWSACDYNKLAYRAKELAGKGWKQALIGLEVEGIVEKRGSGRRPGERNIEPELIPLVEQVLSSWKVPSVDTEPNSARPRAGTGERELKKGQEPTWDLFICHASEDKNEVARPLAEALRTKGMKVWYDDFTLTLGDSLRRSIDSGLTRSRYGIVILSPNFFKKDWPQKELDGLVSKEDGRQKVILPIWHQVRREDVLEYSPTLADKLAVSTQDGLDAVVNAILEVVIQKKKEVRSTQGTRGTGLNRMTVAQASESFALTPTTEAAPTTPQFETTKSRPTPPLVYEVTQMQSNGVRRDLPSVGFNLDNRADYPVRIRVFAEVVLNGKSIGYPSGWSGLYNGKRIWNLNPKGRAGSGIKDGNFTIPLDRIRKDETLMIKVIIKVVDDELDSPLPVGWVYDPKRNDWYYEPSA